MSASPGQLPGSLHIIVSSDKKEITRAPRPGIQSNPVRRQAPWRMGRRNLKANQSEVGSALASRRPIGRPPIASELVPGLIANSSKPLSSSK